MVFTWTLANSLFGLIHSRVYRVQGSDIRAKAVIRLCVKATGALGNSAVSVRIAFPLPRTGRFGA
jgi:hypothetical protein